MKRPFHAAQALLIVSLSALSSCNINIDWESHQPLGFPTDDSLGPAFLAKHATEDGRVTTYSVSGQTRRFPRGNTDLKGAIVVSTKVTEDVPYLGIEVKSVDATTAEALGIEPWSGVLVAKVEDGQPAAAAGLRRGDLILGAGDVEFTSDEQFADFLTSSLLPADSVPFSISRSVTEFVRDSLLLDVFVGGRSVEETESNRIDFDLDPGLIQSAGLGVVTIPVDLSEEIWGYRESTALVAAVVTGSPAYLAGVRAGDRVLRVRGVPVTSASEIASFGSGSLESLELELDGPLGAHAASIQLESDVLKESDFEIPILVDYDRRVDRSSLSVLDFIFQFGFNRRVNYSLARSRQPRRSSHLSILPLGMFEFTRTPTKATNRLFWIIRWSSEV